MIKDRSNSNGLPIQNSSAAFVLSLNSEDLESTLQIAVSHRENIKKKRAFGRGNPWLGSVITNLEEEGEKLA